LFLLIAGYLSVTWEEPTIQLKVVRAFHDERYETKRSFAYSIGSQDQIFFLLYYFPFVFVADVVVEQFEWPTAQRGRFVQRSGVQHNLSCIYHKNETGEENPKEKPQPSSATIR
jgi:hypothetical protein